jgi:hypothetical protein
MGPSPRKRGGAGGGKTKRDKGTKIVAVVDGAGHLSQFV